MVQDEPTETPPEAGATLPVATAPATLPLPDHAAFEPEPEGPTGEAAASPAWANDLRKLYNAVVEEPLPDSLIDLLSKLDSTD